MNNEIIDKNLKLIYESPRDYTPYFDFIDIKINPQKKILAKEMDSKGLIKLQGEFCYKTDFGKEVMDKGGWLNYLSSFENQSNTPQTTNTNATRYKDSIKKFTIKSWKLLSENKLVSGFLLIVIIYILKTVFGIDLK